MAENSVKLFFSSIGRVGALKRIEKIILKRLLNKGIKKHIKIPRQTAFEQLGPAAGEY